MVNEFDGGEDHRPESIGLISQKSIFEKAISKWGNASQMMMAQEECGELVACISQFIRGRKSKFHLAEEVADVEIMCEQIRIMIGDEIVDREKRKKVVRLAERLGLHNVPYGG